jgi:flagellar motor switch protein FliN/FliY
MADEELLEEGEEKQGSEVKTENVPESAEEASSENDDAVDGEQAAEMSAQSEEAVPEEAVEADGDESQDGSEEQSVDELAEQQMLAELERLEAEGQDSDSSEDTFKDIQKPDFPAFSQSTTAAQEKNLDLLLDVNLPISIELGRTTMKIKEILALGPGSVVELKKLAGEPVDLLVNNNIVAKGEVVVVDENFGLRIVSLLSREERLRSLEE